MAEVSPFRGIRYNTEKITELSKVVVPPFDVISREEQQSAYATHPNNMIRLELNRGGEEAASGSDPHGLAAGHFHAWRSEGILIQDREPAFYLTATDFELGGGTVCRFGFIGRVRLTPFEERIVVPHEKTFSQVRSERLELMKACHANFSPIFAMYRDPGDALLNEVTSSAAAHAPVIDFVDANGHRHRLWRIVGKALTGRISDALKHRRIYIADGHHRYETALAYRRWMTSVHGALPENHPAHFVMMYLTGMETDGMVILPAHRLLKSVSAELRRRLLARAPAYFEVERLAAADTASPDSRALKAALEDGGLRTRIGVVMKHETDLHLLRLREGVMGRLFADRIAPELIDIDVTVLTRLIFMNILGFDRRRLDDHRLIGYASTLAQGVEKVFAGEYDIGFLLNPTRIDQVRRIADAGLIMPRKATYFYPKVISGLVLNSLEPEDVDHPKLAAGN